MNPKSRVRSFHILTLILRLGTWEYGIGDNLILTQRYILYRRLVRATCKVVALGLVMLVLLLAGYVVANFASTARGKPK